MIRNIENYKFKLGSSSKSPHSSMNLLFSSIIVNSKVWKSITLLGL